MNSDVLIYAGQNRTYSSGNHSVVGMRIYETYTTTGTAIGSCTGMVIQSLLTSFGTGTTAYVQGINCTALVAPIGSRTINSVLGAHIDTSMTGSTDLAINNWVKVLELTAYPSFNPWTNTVPEFYGIDLTGDAGGPVTDVYGIKIGLWGGGATNTYGLKIESNGAVSNLYGLYVAEQIGAAVLNYNIYSAGATSHNLFEGFVVASSSLSQANGSEIALYVDPSINKSTSGDSYGIVVEPSFTNVPGSVVGVASFFTGADRDIPRIVGDLTQIIHYYTGAMKVLGSFTGKEVSVSLTGGIGSVVAGNGILFNGSVDTTATTTLNYLYGLNLDFSGINVSTVIAGDFYGINIIPPPCNVVGIAYGLYIGDFSSGGYGGYGSGASAAFNIRSVGAGRNLFEGRTIQGVPNSAIPSGELMNSQCSYYLNEAGNQMVVKVRYSTGVIKTGTVALT